MPKRALIVNRSGEWSLDQWHGRAEGAGREHHAWRIAYRGAALLDEHDHERHQLGIQLASETSVRRTKGEPTTLRRIRRDFGDSIKGWASVFGVSEHMLAAVLATESGGKPTATRIEAHLKDRSIGLAQTLTATASQVYKGLSADERAFFTPSLGKLTPEPKGGDVEAWIHVLSEAHTSIGLGAAVLRALDRDLMLRGDPVLLYAAYNAGGVYEDDDDPWGLRNYDPDGRGPRPGALDHFTKWFGDACHVYNTEAPP